MIPKVYAVVFEFQSTGHLSCGTRAATDTRSTPRLHLYAAEARDLGANASAVDFLPFTDLEESVRHDVKTVRSSPFFPKDIPVSGFVYDCRSGRLREVR